MSQELKPCPFCGAEADTFCTASDYPDWHAKCLECGASADIKGPNDLHFWNRRAAPVPPAGDLPEWAQIQILKNGIGERDGDIERLEAELTKARERQKHLESFLKIASERLPKKHRTIKLHIDQCLRDAHQSAPAAKGEHDERT